jgi:hypothetical protein
MVLMDHSKKTATDDMLLRSRKIIARMLRKTASSKTVWILVFFIVVGIGLIM